MHTTPDGGFSFQYTTPDGKTVQVHGDLSHGTGRFFDESTQTTYAFQNGKLTNTYTLDEGRAVATVEPLFTATGLVAGAGVGGLGIKAGEMGWQGIKTCSAVKPSAAARASASAAVPRPWLPAPSLPQSSAPNLQPITSPPHQPNTRRYPMLLPLLRASTRRR